MKMKIACGVLGVMIALSLIACDDSPSEDDVFVAVADISGVPASGTVNVPLTLTGTVAPSVATNKDIVWTVKDGQATVDDGVLTATAPGAVVVIATITNGASLTEPYTQEFTVTISAAAQQCECDDPCTIENCACPDCPGPAQPALTAVSGISGVPASGTVGVPLTLTGTVEPATATNKTIVWTVKDGPATVDNDVLTATAPGAVVVIATITNGATSTTAYTQEFTVTISAAVQQCECDDPCTIENCECPDCPGPAQPAFTAVSGISGVPDSGTVGVPLTLTGTVAPSTATNKTIVWTVKSGTATITAGVLTATVAENVVVTATIANGTSASAPFAKDFTITIHPAGSANIHFGDETFTLTKSVSTPLSIAANDSISVELSRAFASVRWYINGEQRNTLNNQTKITLNAKDLQPGNYSVTAMVSDGVSWYSRTVTFTVGL